MKQISGVIFDFNGTLFHDTAYHNRAWDIFLDNHGIVLSDAEKHEKLHGKTNRDIISVLFDFIPDEKFVKTFSEEKEALYREICLQNRIVLASGAVDLFNFLQDKNIPMAISTASGYENIPFFREQFELDRWFSSDRFIYNTGNIPGKPDPALFNLALDALNLSGEEILIFEDSEAGIRAAENAGAGRIIIMNSNNEDYSRWDYQIITSFDEVDRSLFI